MLIRHSWLGLLILLPALLHAQEDSQQLGARLRQGIEAYEQLVAELDLRRVPTDQFDYPLVSDNMQRLGERLEALSRLALEVEAQPQPDWRRLADAIQLYENDLHQLRCQSLPLRIWAFLEKHGQKKSAWGLAISHSQQPLSRAQGTFDGEPPDTLELSLKPGERRMAQIIVVPLTKALGRVRGNAGELKGKAGVLPRESISLLPLDYDRLTRAESTEAWWTWATSQAQPDVPLDQAQAFILSLNVPPDLKPGEYRGRLRFDPEQAGAMQLEVQVTVAAGEGAVQ